MEKGVAVNKGPALRAAAAETPQAIVTLDAKAILGHVLRSDRFDATLRMLDARRFADKGVVLRVDAHSWCPLFDQLSFCLEDHGIELPDSGEALRSWFLYMDFSALEREMFQGDGFFATPHGKAMASLVERGFTIIDAQGRRWHYTIFDMSSSNARNSIVSFLADVGYDVHGHEVRIYDELSRRLCLDVDVAELKAQQPKAILWNKYHAYRALYLSTATRVLSSEAFELTKESVLVIDTASVSLPCAIRSAHVVSQTSSGDAQVEFRIASKEDGGAIELRLFDGEGLVSPGYAACIRDAAFNGNGKGGQPSSFQIRMPFAKGVVHEVDFHRFVAEALDVEESQLSRLRIEDAFGIKRDLSKVQVILTTDMLKCHEWLKAWLSLSDERMSEYRTDGSPDPMDYYFTKMREYDHALYVLSKHRKAGSAHTITTNAQYLSTLLMSPSEFDDFVSARFEEASAALFDIEKAARALIGTEESDGDESAMQYALRRNPEFVHDPHMHAQLLNDVNSELVDLACGKIPVKGTLRLLSQDLLAFLCLLLVRIDDDAATSAATGIERHCLSEGELYLPHYDEKVNSTGLLAVFRNPHLSRSEQCVVRPLPQSEESLYARYFGHLHDVVMLSCESPAPMVLGGADYDGDTVHVYDDAAIVDAVLSGAYMDEGDALARRFPIVDLSGIDVEASGATHNAHGADDELIGTHISCAQLFKSFRSNVGILSNSALRLSTVLYGTHEGIEGVDAGPGASLSDDACANYAIAVGIDIDSIKTGVRLDMGDLQIQGERKQLSKFGVSGKLVPRDLGFLQFRDATARMLKESMTPVWEYAALDDGTAGCWKIALRAQDEPSFSTLNLESDLSQNGALKGVSVSNVQRLPWLMMKEARRIRSLADSPGYIGAKSDPSPSPLEEAVFLVENCVDLEKLRTIKSMVSACQSAFAALGTLYRRTARAKKSPAFGKARRRAQEYPTRFSEEEVDAILAGALADMQAYFERGDGYEISDALRAFEKTGFEDWALCPAGTRTEALRRFLPGLDFSEDFRELMEDDALVNGFMIPFYLLGAAQAIEESRTPMPLAAVLELSEGSEANDSEGWGRSDESDDYISKDATLYNEFVELINLRRSENASRSSIIEELSSLLKERIQSIMGPGEALVDYLSLLRYDNDVVAAKNRCFANEHYTSQALFWSLLTAEDMKRVLG